MCDNLSAFSVCGSFYASLGKDGKVRIWNTATDSLLREYIPDKHLSSPITCLKWIVSKSGKRKSESDTSMSLSLLVLGTNSGHLLVYNLSLSSLVASITSKSKVCCFAWNENSKEDIFTLSENKYVSVWNLQNKSVNNLWKISKGKIKVIELSEDSSLLITASNSIGVWNIESKTLLKTFIGHVGEVASILSIPIANDLYIVTASKGDRMLSVWSIKGKEKTAIANFKTDEPVSSISYNNNNNGQTSLVAVNNCGALHYFNHQLNGKCLKPIDATSTIVIFKDNEKKYGVSIINARVCTDNQILVVYGSGYLLSFDKIDLKSTLNSNRNGVISIIREDKISEIIKHNKEKEENRINFKTKETDSKDTIYSVGGGPLTNGDVIRHPYSLKRKNNTSSIQELVMEDRLKNLLIEKPDQQTSNGICAIQTEGLTQLLIQGLNSRDKNILDSVLLNRKESVIEKTVKKIPPQYLTPLIQEVVRNVQKSFIRHTSLRWLRYIVLCHTSVLQSNPSLISAFLPMLSQIETRSTTMLPLIRLNGRLNLLLDQMNRKSEAHVIPEEKRTENNVVEYQDQDSEEDNSDDIIMGLQEDATSDVSDDVWEEMSDNDDPMSVDENDNASNNYEESEDDSEEDDEILVNGDKSSEED